MAENVRYIISLEDKFSGNITNAGKHVDTFQQKILSVGRTLGISFAAYKVVQGIKNLGQKILSLGSEFEQAEISFGTLLQSMSKGKQLLAELQQFAKVTPFTSSETLELSKQLLAVGVATEQVIPTMRMLGDISGGVGMDKLPRLVLNLGQVKAQTKLTGRELRDFAIAGVPLLDELAKITGKTAQEVQGMVAKGQVSYEMVIKAMQAMTSEGGKFYKMMEKQSQSAGGLYSTLRDNLELIGVNIGKRLMPQIKTFEKGLISLTDKLLRWVKIPVTKELQDESREVNLLVAKLSDLNISNEDRQAAYMKLKEIQPGVVEGVDKENVSVEKLKDNLTEYNRQMVIKMAMATLERDEQKALERQAKIQEDINNLLWRKATLGNRADASLFDLNQQLDKSIELLGESEDVDVLKKYRKDIQGLITGGEFEQAIKRSQEIIEWGNEFGLKGWGLVKPAQNIKYLTGQVSGLVGELNKSKDESFDLGKRIDAMKTSLGIDKVVTTTTTVVPDQETEDMMTKITAQSPKIFNINIEKLVETINNNVTNLQEGMAESKKIVVEAMMDALNQTQITALQ